MIIDSSYFTGNISIAQLGQTEVEENLDVYIEQYEKEYYKKALGYELFNSFINGVDVGSDEEMEDRWSNILNGVSFQFFSDYLVYGGIAKDAARYIYWHYTKDLFELQTGIGTVKTKGQGSITVSPQNKMITAWNEMAASTQVLWKFLRVNSDTYFLNSSLLVDRTLITSQNIYGV